VVISDQLHLPQTDVVIYAKDLYFLGNDAQIITTPLPFTNRAGPNATPQVVYPENYPDENKRGLRNPSSGSAAGHGAGGLKAGNIELHIKEFYSLNDLQEDIIATRFVLRGGKGQDPGNGTNGISSPYRLSRYSSCATRRHPLGLPFCTTEITWCTYNNSLSGYYIIYAYCNNGPGTNEYMQGLNTVAMPVDGTHAKPSGQPGKGGEGGLLTMPSGFNLSAYDEFGFGTPGTKGPTYSGGGASVPSKAVRIQHNTPFIPFVPCGWAILQKRATSGGNSAASPGPPPHGSNESPGGPAYEDAPYAWLHPLLAGWALNAIKDDYLSNRIIEAEMRMKEYIMAINLYVDDAASWTALSEDDQYALMQIYDEMQILLFRIENNLDYFGNPAGWVPMLSFEAYLNNFDNEIDRAINMLYLAYWIKTKAQNDNQQVKALAAARDALREELDSAKTQFDEEEGKLADLRTEAENLRAKIYQKRLEIKQKETDLEQQAIDEARGPLWVLFARSGLKGAAMAFSIFPAWQPELGRIGEGIRVISNIDPEKPWDTIIGETDVAKKFLDSQFEAATKAQKEANSKVDKNSVEAKKVEYLGNLRDASEGLTASLKDMRDFFASIEASQEEVDAELEKLKSASDDFQQLVKDVRDLIVENAKVARKILNTMQTIGSLSNLITKNILEIDALNRSVSAGEAVMNQNAMLYLENMERRTHDRLLKYHYYLAKAYEYRLLSFYPQQLDLQPLMEKFREIAVLNLAKPDDKHTISFEQFDSFKGIYQDILGTVAQEIIDGYSEYQLNRELQSDIYFQLAPEALEILNNEEKIVLNLVNEGIFPQARENLRIYDLGVYSIETVPVNGSYDPQATVQLYLEHSGLSEIKLDGRIYQFKHYGQSSSNSPNSDSQGASHPIFWEADYQPAIDILTNTKVSPYTTSLLTTVLGGVPNDIELFSRPSTWADLTISKTVTNNGVVDIHITENHWFKLTYDYTKKHPDSNLIELEVKVSTAELMGPGNMVVADADLTPYFIVADIPDVNGRQDARGRFIRIYVQNLAGSIAITAQEKYGDWLFRKWTDGDGNELPGGPMTDLTIIFDLDTNQIVSAQYAEGTLFFDSDEDADVDGVDLYELAMKLANNEEDDSRIANFARAFGHQNQNGGATAGVYYKAPSSLTSHKTKMIEKVMHHCCPK
jgi:hypothetical protein